MQTEKILLIQELNRVKNYIKRLSKKYPYDFEMLIKEIDDVQNKIKVN